MILVYPDPLVEGRDHLSRILCDLRCELRLESLATIQCKICGLHNIAPHAGPCHRFLSKPSGCWSERSEGPERPKAADLPSGPWRPLIP